MNAALVCLGAMVLFALGYRFYSRFLSQNVFALSADEPMPSETLRDDMDFVPTDTHILVGHHYASIAGAAPIIGPAIAVIWGWVPALIWIVFGTIFMGAVHDFSTLVMSTRHQGKSMGAISAKVLGERSRSLFLVSIFALVLLVCAVFARAISALFVAQPATVIPINFEIVVALAIGYVCYKKGMKLLWPSVVALVALYAMVFVGLQFPITFGTLAVATQQNIWIILLFAYAFVASTLPVWMLLQPRDLINSHQLFVGLGFLLLSIFIAAPPMVAPAIQLGGVEGSPPVFPFLFITIACGAISGFHGLVSSGTSSKQLKSAIDARPVGYGAMLGEGLLAVIATVAVSAGLADWAGHYHNFQAAASGGVKHFVAGAAQLLSGIGIPVDVAAVLVAILVISFAATTLDTAVRIQRYILQELGEIYKVPALQQPYVAAFVAVLLPLVLCFAGQEKALWPLFGASNQLLAGLSLLVVTLWLKSEGKPWVYTGVPMVLILSLSALSLVMNLNTYLQEGKYLLLSTGLLLLVIFVWIVLEAWKQAGLNQGQKIEESG